MSETKRKTQANGAAIKIEKHVPIPPTSAAKFPVGELDVGDSFVVPKELGPAARNHVQYFRRGHPHSKFVTRLVENGLRIWRVS